MSTDRLREIKSALQLRFQRRTWRRANPRCRDFSCRRYMSKRQFGVFSDQSGVSGKTGVSDRPVRHMVKHLTKESLLAATVTNWVCVPTSPVGLNGPPGWCRVLSTQTGLEKSLPHNSTQSSAGKAATWEKTTTWEKTSSLFPFSFSQERISPRCRLSKTCYLVGDKGIKNPVPPNKMSRMHYKPSW